MYEDIIEEFNSVKLELERGAERVAKVFSENKDKEENARINRELAKSKLKTMNIDEVVKLTGVGNGRKKSNK